MRASFRSSRPKCARPLTRRRQDDRKKFARLLRKRFSRPLRAEAPRWGARSRAERYIRTVWATAKAFAPSRANSSCRARLPAALLTMLPSRGYPRPSSTCRLCRIRWSQIREVRNFPLRQGPPPSFRNRRSWFRSKSRRRGFRPSARFAQTVRLRLRNRDRRTALTIYPKDRYRKGYTPFPPRSRRGGRNSARRRSRALIPRDRTLTRSPRTYSS